MSKDKRDESVNVLSAMFAGFEAEILYDVLDSNKGELEATIDQLLSMSTELTPKKKPTPSPTPAKPSPSKPINIPAAPAPVTPNPESLEWPKKMTPPTSFPIPVLPTPSPTAPGVPEELSKKTAEERRLEALKNELVVEFQKLSNQQRLIAQQRSELNLDFDKLDQQTKILIEKQESLTRTEANFTSNVEKTNKELEARRAELEAEFIEKYRVLHERMALLVDATQQQEREKRGKEASKAVRQQEKAARRQAEDEQRRATESLGASLRDENEELKRTLTEVTALFQREKLDWKAKERVLLIRSYENVASAILNGIATLRASDPAEYLTIDQAVSSSVKEAIAPPAQNLIDFNVDPEEDATEEEEEEEEEGGKVVVFPEVD